MKFGGHETFPIREGWLHKGLKLLMERPDLLIDQYAADHLGVGRNMAKSIRHWLVATELATVDAPQKGTRIQSFRVTKLGQLIGNKDPYFLELGTWWALHSNLVINPDYAASWHWFFNYFNLNRFEKSVCFEAQKRYLEMSRQRMPSLKTLDRDLSCLLASYSVQIPPKQQDPEDASNCPFHELGILNHYKTSGYYEINRGIKNVPPHILGYVLSRTFEEAQTGEGAVDIPFQNMIQAIGGPSRILALADESLFELAQRAENELPTGEISITGLAGERILRVQRKSPIQWMEECYQSIAEITSYAS